MVNAIIDAISSSLREVFDDRYNIYREEMKQDSEEPCFFISCMNPEERLFLGNKYFRQYPFCIQYVPETRGKEKEECYAAAERLFLCLEYLTVDDDIVRGTKMNYKVTDGILHFFVNYDMYVYKTAKPAPAMENVSSETLVKG